MGLKVSQRLQLGTGLLGLLARVSIHCGLSMQPGLPDNMVIEYQRQQREGGREGEVGGKREAKYVLPFTTEPQKSSGTFSTTFIKEFTKIPSSSKRENKKSISCWRYANHSSRVKACGNKM